MYLLYTCNTPTSLSRLNSGLSSKGQPILNHLLPRTKKMWANLVQQRKPMLKLKLVDSSKRYICQRDWDEIICYSYQKPTLICHFHQNHWTIVTLPIVDLSHFWQSKSQMSSIRLQWWKYWHPRRNTQRRST